MGFRALLSNQACCLYADGLTDALLLCDPCFAEIGPGFFETIVIGDFPADEARGYLDHCLQAVGKPPVSDADWDAVYGVSQRCMHAVVWAAHYYVSGPTRARPGKAVYSRCLVAVAPGCVILQGSWPGLEATVHQR
jgi:hypothetical protein